MTRTIAVMLAVALALLVTSAPAWTARESKISLTKHNLSIDGPGDTKAASETQICVFCHTPHAATPGITPLWNRALSGATYTVYTSSSLDAEALQGTLAQPGGSSKLCLSCHDGTLAIGNVNVLNGQGSSNPQGTQSIAMNNTGSGGTMPGGSTGGETSGYTRKLGTDLTNDHPISVTYSQALASRDGELREVNSEQKWPTTGNVGETIGVRSTGYKPKLPLEPTGTANAGQVQCATCHDPHSRETDSTKGNQKFLRLNRFQEAAPTASYSAANDIICLSCHDKNKVSGSWAYSAHANPDVADETYKSTPGDQREFPSGLPVWKAACLNCHDTHTVQGARRLLREGTDSTATPKTGGNPALEQVCFQCHTDSASSIIGTATGTVPDIKAEFNLARRMPITLSDEKHDIDANFQDATFIDCTGSTADTSGCGKDFAEPRGRLGVGNLNNRHAECTDCHNPHRVVRFADFRGANATGSLSGTPDAAATHRHTDTNGYVHSNIISGVLRGTWGVEPTYTSASFHDLPGGYAVKRGDPGSSTSTAATASYVTREYQICLKCHSDYGYSDDNTYPNSSSRPQLGGAGLTAANANGHSNFTTYTNQAKEFQAPAGHNVNVGSTSRGTEAGAELNSNNHRSWHPVMAPTGRTGRASGGFLTPWNNTGALGNQTMYCSDCHGAATSQGTAIPTGPQGPHGSSYNFLLRGDWSTSTGEGQHSTGLCFKCHSASRYAGSSGGTGFQTNDRGDGHAYHADKIDTSMKCNFCHVAVPHGWKNRSLLVNLNDVGPEAGLPVGTNVWTSSMNNSGYTNGPYYRKAFLRISSFPSGRWDETNCNGGRDGMRNNCENPR